VQKASASGGLCTRLPTEALPLDPTTGLPSPNLLIGQCLFYASLGESPPSKKNQKSRKIRRDRKTRDTNSWLYDTVKKFGPNLTLLFLNCTNFDQLILGKIIKNVATRCQILKQNAPNSVSVGAPPQTLLGKLAALPRLPS